VSSLMSAFGTYQTLISTLGMSALRGKADIAHLRSNVRHGSKCEKRVPSSHVRSEAVSGMYAFPLTPSHHQLGAHSHQPAAQLIWSRGEALERELLSEQLV